MYGTDTTMANKAAEHLNLQIDALRERISRNERLQDQWICGRGNGIENEGLAKEHDKLCDQMEALCRERRML